jgi:hypothetical protein
MPTPFKREPVLLVVQLLSRNDMTPFVMFHGLLLSMQTVADVKVFRLHSTQPPPRMTMGEFRMYMEYCCTDDIFA